MRWGVGLWSAGVVGTTLAVGAAAAALDAKATEGKTEFAARCAGCHGNSLEGGSHAPALVGPTFFAEWSGKRARLVYSRIISTMPQDSPGTLTEAQALAIALFVFAENGVSFGDKSIQRANDLNTLSIASPQ